MNHDHHGARIHRDHSCGMGQTGGPPHHRPRLFSRIAQRTFVVLPTIRTRNQKDDHGKYPWHRPCGKPARGWRQSETSSARCRLPPRLMFPMYRVEVDVYLPLAGRALVHSHTCLSKHNDSPIRHLYASRHFLPAYSGSGVGYPCTHPARPVSGSSRGPGRGGSRLDGRGRHSHSRGKRHRK